MDSARTPTGKQEAFRWAGWLFLFLSVFLWDGCASKRAVYPVRQVIPPPVSFEWKTVQNGIELAEWVGTYPPLRCWVVRIDLTNPDLDVIVTPGLNDDEETEGEVIGRYVSTFARDFDTDIAVNASPFFPRRYNDRMPQMVAGLAISDGQMYSAGNGRYAAISFFSSEDEAYRARIDIPEAGSTSGGTDDRTEVLDAVGGFHMVLRQSKVVAPEPTVRNPMNLVGTADGGRTLYLLVVDGRQPRRSVGFTPVEGALWLRSLGCRDGLFLDGGGSTTLVVRDEAGDQQVLNRPVDVRFLYKQRVVATHLGFRVTGQE